MIKKLTAVAVLALGPHVQAATVTVLAGQYYKGQIYTGGLEITYGFDRYGLNGIIGPVSGAGGMEVVFNPAEQYDDITSPLIGVDIDDTTDKVLRTRYGGSISLTMPQNKVVSTGGALTITDLVFNQGEQAFFATLIGQNGVGTVNNVRLWDLRQLSCLNCGYLDLVRTEAATSLFTQAGGLKWMGGYFLESYPYDGMVRTSLTVSAIPEASSIYLAMAGVLTALGLVRPRGMKQS